jgi:DNA-binding CsgD family transcriptional regulator
VIWFLGLLGIAQGLQGKETAARLCMAEVDTLLRQMPAEAIATYGPLSHLTQIALLLGDQAYLAQVQPCLLRFQGLYYDGLIDRLLAAIAILQKDWAAAERWLDRAEQTTKQEGLVVERVHVLSLRAEMALAQVGVAVARPFLEQGYELLLAAGAMMRADQLAQQLAAMSEPPLAQPIFPAGLSLREVTVLRLVAAGYTNRHIAIDLVISEKTVANHLTHIFNKIGADNRAAAATFAAQHQLL